MKNKKNTICFICGDPGGTNAIIPVIKKIQLDKILFFFTLGYVEAINILSNQNLNFDKIRENIDCFSISEIFKKNGTSILVTGTSYNSIGVEKRFIHAAKRMNIQSLAVLDFWSNYRSRFCDEKGNLKYVPEKIAIMDIHAYNQMIDDGFKPETLIITGQPAFDKLDICKQDFTELKNQKIRDFFNINIHDLLVVFVSQPLSALFGNDSSNPLFLGYNEKIVLDYLIIALEQISRNSDKKIVLLIRPHPNEDEEKYCELNSKNIRIFVSKKCYSREVVMTSDLVVGMYSELLVEACYLGCIVLSLQPDLKYRDNLPTNKWGHSMPVYAKEKINDAVRIMLLDSNVRQDMKRRVNQFRNDGGATERVVNLIYQITTQSRTEGN